MLLAFLNVEHQRDAAVGRQMIRRADADAREDALRHQRLTRLFDGARPVAFARMDGECAAREFLVLILEPLEGDRAEIVLPARVHFISEIEEKMYVDRHSVRLN